MKELGFTNGDCRGAHSPLDEVVPANGKAGACIEESKGAGNLAASPEDPVGEICRGLDEVGVDVADSPPTMPPDDGADEDVAATPPLKGVPEPLAEIRPPVGTEVELIKCGGMLNTLGACGTETLRPSPGMPFDPLMEVVLELVLLDAPVDEDEEVTEMPCPVSPSPPTSSSLDFNLPVRSWNEGTSRAGDTEKLTSRM
jgi:hypothetical protein